jgi:hypothetical protein
MSTKMEEAKFSGLWQRATHGAGDAQDARELAAEAFRARCEEAKLPYLAGTVEVLQKAEVEKDAQIKALADALKRRCRDHREDCACGGCSALRLVGRIT